MDKHKALIEKVMLVISNAERAAIGVGPLLSVDQMLLNDADYIRPQATAALNAVYEALKEPSEEMVENICAAHTRSRWPEDFGKQAQALRRESAILGWVSALSSSPLGEE